MGRVTRQCQQSAFAHPLGWFADDVDELNNTDPLPDRQGSPTASQVTIGRAVEVSRRLFASRHLVMLCRCAPSAI
jgi:hypothetical protein